MKKETLDNYTNGKLLAYARFRDEAKKCFYNNDVEGYRRLKNLSDICMNQMVAIVGMYKYDGDAEKADFYLMEMLYFENGILKNFDLSDSL